MEDQTLNEEQVTPEADLGDVIGSSLDEKDSKEELADSDSVVEDSKEPEAPVEAPVAPEVNPVPAPANTPVTPAIIPQGHSQNAVDPMNAPAATSNNVATQLTADAVAQKAFFENQPKVMMNIPLKEGEKAGAYEVINVNGYRLQIPKGVVVSLAQGVAEILGEHYNIQLGTGAIPEEASVRADRDENTAKALM